MKHSFNLKGLFAPIWINRFNYLISFGILSGLLTFYWLNALSWYEGSLIAKGISNFYDWPIHFAISTRVAFQEFNFWFLQSPFVSGVKNTYPIVADIPSGFLLRFGLDLRMAFLLPSIFLSYLMLLSVFKFAKFHGFSSKKVFVFVLLILFVAAGDFAEIASRLFIDKTLFIEGNFDQFSFVDKIPSALIFILSPSKGFILGFTLFVTSIWLIELIKMHQFRVTLLFTLILLNVVLFFIHPHTLICLTVFQFFYFVENAKQPRIRNGMLFCLVFTIIFVLIYKYAILSNQNEFFFASYKFDFSWIEYNYQQSIFNFLKVNGGLFFFITVLCNIVASKTSPYARCALAILLLFLSNQWQPNPYDNVKLYFYYNFFSAFVLLKQIELIKSRPYLIIQGALILLSILPGSIDMINISLKKRNSFVLFSKHEIELAEQIKISTSPLEVFLINNRQNHFLPALTGRQAFIWHNFVVETLGIDYREKAIVRKTYFDSHNICAIEGYALNYIIEGSSLDYGYFEQKWNMGFFINSKYFFQGRVNQQFESMPWDKYFAEVNSLSYKVTKLGAENFENCK